MKVRFYGVRGSIATAGDDTRRYGGNTSCVAVEAGEELLIFDAGTGIRKLGCDLGPTGVRASLFFSHLHWDHIQGFPFFTPAFVPGLVELSRGADLLIYDAMYTPEEYEGEGGRASRRGWGHSTFEAGARVAEAASVRELCLFHHDPAHDDAFLDALGARARKRFDATSVATEGLELWL